MARHFDASRFPAVALSSGLLATLLVVGGCTPSPTTTVDRSPETTATVLTAQERGEARREALRAARDAWTAFENNDPDGIREHFEPELATKFVEQIERYAAEGRQRNRVYEVTYFDVTKLNEDGTVATVSIRVIDNSYFVEPDGSTTEPYGEERGVEMTVTRDTPDGDFIVTGFTSVSAFLE